MGTYETNLANVDPAKATRAALGNPIFYLFLYNNNFCSECFNRFAANMLSLDFCSLKIITTLSL